MNDLKPRDVLVYAVNGLGDESNAQEAIDWFDGEQARQDAAVAAAREEMRESCALWMQGPDPTMMDVANGETVRGTPLTATPLADRIAELEERDALLVRDVNHLMGQALDNKARAEKAEAERDALAEKWSHATATADAVTALTERATACIGGFPVETVAEAVERVVKERDALRAQVEAVRAVASRVEAARGSMFAARDVAGDVLAAMDGAKLQGG